MVRRGEAAPAGLVAVVSLVLRAGSGTARILRAGLGCVLRETHGRDARATTHGRDARATSAGGYGINGSHGHAVGA
jgi:hypothetical protein